MMNKFFIIEYATHSQIDKDAALLITEHEASTEALLNVLKLKK